MSSFSYSLRQNKTRKKRYSHVIPHEQVKEFIEGDINYHNLCADCLSSPVERYKYVTFHRNLGLDVREPTVEEELAYKQYRLGRIGK